MRERRWSADRTGTAETDPVSADEETPPGGIGPPGEDPGNGQTEDNADLENKARNLVLRMLTHSPRTRAQLERSLHRKEYPDEVVEKVLNGLDEAGLIDDAAFAQAWVNSRQYSRHLSRRALTQELRTRGVEEETVREAVAEVSDEDEQDGARALARKSLRGSRTKEKEARIRRALGVLARKGYPGGLSYRIVREELEQEGLEADLDSGEF
ncbi:regulatory protein RecX [Nocardiopsis valliformis]|uniref:regulatory protein RecX n=1 Tax=Nocardiopsis valliformis TaxID=239974 RepID=UPI0003477BF2|nr:regulatory protein RecX [Nocardiopsis valliformis]